MQFKTKDGTVYNYHQPQDIYEPVSDEKLKRFETLLADLRIKWVNDPSKRFLYERQAKVIQAGIDIIKKKLSRTQRKML